MMDDESQTFIDLLTKKSQQLANLQAGYDRLKNDLALANAELQKRNEQMPLITDLRDEITQLKQVIKKIREMCGVY